MFYLLLYVNEQGQMIILTWARQEFRSDLANIASRRVTTLLTASLTVSEHGSRRLESM